MAPRDKVYPDSEGLASAPPPAGAYYSVKDQPLPPPATYRGTRRHNRNPCCCFLIWFFSILTTIAVILGIAVLIFWLVVQPKAPKYEVNNVRISGLDVTASTLNTNTSFELMARNPNKKIGIYYDEINVNLQTMGLSLGDEQLPSFYQGHKNTTIIEGELQSGPVVVDDVKKTELLAAQSIGKVPLKLSVDVRARLKIGSWKSRRFTVKVRCDINVDLSITTASQVVDKHCNLDNW